MALEPARDAHLRPQVPPHDEADPFPTQAPSGRGLSARAGEMTREIRTALAPRLASSLAAAQRLPPEAAAAGAIAVGALILAMLAADGNVEFPGPSFEAGLSSRPSSQAVVTSEAPRAPAALTSEVLAERLVEDPAFASCARGGPSSPSSEPLSDAALPPPPPPEATRASGSGKDAVAVLSSAVPLPADPTLRLLEQVRTRRALPAEATPSAAGLAAPAQERAAGAEPAFAVQLVAVAKREQAAEAWARLQRENADLLGRLQPIIVEPERRVSTLYRLRAGPIASQREAQALCTSLTRRAVDCIVVQAGG